MASYVMRLNGPLREGEIVAVCVGVLSELTYMHRITFYQDRDGCNHPVAASVAQALTERGMAAVAQEVP